MTRIQFDASDSKGRASAAECGCESQQQQQQQQQHNGAGRRRYGNVAASWRIMLAVACIALAIVLLVVGIVLLVWVRPRRNNLLLISYDGFRWDYLQRCLKDMPTYQGLIASGVWARHGMKNAFATKTLPNHYVMATGLYEESNGIVGNDFWDPQLGRCHYFSQKSKTDPRFFLGEPIWATNQLAGGTSGCVMWASCDVPIKGQRASHYISLNESMPWEKRLDRIIQWFSDADEPINLGVLYIEQPDLTGHRFGPDAPQIRDMLMLLDTFTKRILQKLEQHSLLETTNIILTSDHGMTSTPKENSVDLDEFVNTTWIKGAYGGSPNANIMPAPGFTDKLVEALSKADHITVYKKDEIPPEYHYHDSDRILPVQVFADMHWRLTGSTIEEQMGNALRVFDRSDGVNLGDHGYNNSEPDMHPYFIAVGPDFKSGYTKEDTFDNVDLYPLMCHLLHVDPAPNNGSISRVQDLLSIDYGIYRLLCYTSALHLAIAVLLLILIVQTVMFWWYNNNVRK